VEIALEKAIFGRNFVLDKTEQSTFSLKWGKASPKVVSFERKFTPPASFCTLSMLEAADACKTGSCHRTFFPSSSKMDLLTDPQTQKLFV